MRIDRTHRPWLAASCWILAAALLLYVLEAVRTQRVGGGTAIGLALGTVGFGFMLFAAALGIRKRFPIWRIGRAQHWMRGHLWLGTLALPLIFLHAGFRFGGWLTSTLMVLLIVVVVSGLFGAYLQHTLPSQMMREVQFETIYDQIDHIRTGLITEARERVQSVAEEMAPGRGAGATVVLTYIGAIPEINVELKEFTDTFAAQIEPWLENKASKSPLNDRTQSAQLFEGLHRLMPERAWKTVDALEEICEEKRQLDRQVVLHRTMHAWLMCHIPLSVALIVLGFVHAIGSLRY
ncbi:MAG TPA: hypothetical protein VMD92_02865 [Acidobacteriaceae bacterium]|jgi:hypothetical protein|nr:hypothetical protein [Acidobacteriaceae bacterium]